jgi:hypothetical protein
MSSPTCDFSMLTIDATPLNAECGRLLQKMLQHNACIRGLTLRHCVQDADVWRSVCAGPAANRHLERLDLTDEIDVPPGTVAVAALGGGPASSLKTFRVAPRKWSPREFDELVAALRVNTALQRVDIAQERGFPAEQLEPVLDLLRTYSFALQSVRMAARWLMPTRSYQSPIDELLQRNRLVRRVVERLEGRRVPHFPPGRVAGPDARVRHDPHPPVPLRAAREPGAVRGASCPRGGSGGGNAERAKEKPRPAAASVGRLS